jgi:hypothetical protein
MQKNLRKVIDVKWMQYSFMIVFTAFLTSQRIGLSAKPNRYGGVAAPPIQKTATSGT